jgi:hypothetical protein
MEYRILRRSITDHWIGGTKKENKRPDLRNQEGRNQEDRIGEHDKLDPRNWDWKNND